MLIVRYSLNVASSFNRTFMELKYHRPTTAHSRFTGFNRTFMELKCEMVSIFLRNNTVLIVPLWN